MNKIIITTICLILLGCDKNTQIIREEDSRIIDIKKRYKVINIDSCEYIVVTPNRFVYAEETLLTHKGNCKYCIERNKKAAQK